MDVADDRLRAEDFVPATGGEWYGLLFENRSLRLRPALTWCFDFAFEDVIRDDEESPLGLTVEWASVPGQNWRHFAGQRVTCERFADPVEASVYHYAHHRFETVALDLVEQRGHALRTVATVSGDLDRLGVDPVRADAWLSFTGILVSLPDAPDPETALSRLGEFTDTRGLAFDARTPGGALRFVSGAGDPGAGPA
jgi:hypothetical protein